MVTRSDKLAMIGPSLADLVLEIFCFAASPSFRGVATLVSKARQAVKDAGSSSPELAKDHSDLGKRITDALVTKVKAAREQCLDRGIDTSLLAQAESAVAALISTDAEQDLAVLSAVRDPVGFENYLRTRAAKHRQQIEEQAEPYFDALVQAVAATYVEIAPWSDSFVVIALKSLLGECSDIKEYLNASQIENRQLFSQILQILQGLTEAIEALSKPSHTERVFFGGRPDVVAENRFVKRSEQEHLNPLITDPTKQRTVLVGMRGCGKTQLAASLAKQCEDANWNLVAWVNAGSRESITSDLVELAKKLEINTSDQPAADYIIRRLFTRLNSAVPSDRLIIFDNVENIDDLRELVPRGNGLRVVATTTNNTGWEHQGWDTIKVEVFDRDESIKYLLTATESTDRDAADTLAHRLGDLPLAIAQAAAFAQKRKLDLAQYLDRLDVYRSERVMPAISGHYYARDVATALRVAIDDTLKELETGMSRAARRHLGVLALLAESGVPTRWLDPLTEEHHYQGRRDRDRAADDDAHDALTELIDRSIIQQSADGTTTMLHRLQAQVLRESWSEEEREQACESAVNLLGSVDISRYLRNDTVKQQQETLDLVDQLHAIGMQEHSRVLFESPEISKSLCQAFSYASDLGLHYEALTLGVAVAALEGTRAPDHPNILTARNNLAIAYREAGRVDEAIALFEQVLTDAIRIHGQGHPKTQTTRNNLAIAYQEAGRVDEAITLFEQVLTDSTPFDSTDHPNTVITRNNLATAYLEAGRVDEAIALLEQGLTNIIRIHGQGHPKTLNPRNNLAYAYQEAGRLTEAITLYEQTLTDAIRIHGQGHPKTQTTRNNLAFAYLEAGRLTEAITLYEQTLTDSIRFPIEDHLLTSLMRFSLEAARRELAEQVDSSPTEERGTQD